MVGMQRVSAELWELGFSLPSPACSCLCVWSIDFWWSLCAIHSRQQNLFFCYGDCRNLLFCKEIAIGFEKLFCTWATSVLFQGNVGRSRGGNPLRCMGSWRRRSGHCYFACVQLLIICVDRDGAWKHLSLFVEIRVWLWLLWAKFVAVSMQENMLLAMGKPSSQGAVEKETS